VPPSRSHSPLSVPLAPVGWPNAWRQNLLKYYARLGSQSWVAVALLSMLLLLFVLLLVRPAEKFSSLFRGFHGVKIFSTNLEERKLQSIQSELSRRSRVICARKNFSLQLECELWVVFPFFFLIFFLYFFGWQGGELS